MDISHDFEWRSASKAVAVLDMVLSVLALVMLALVLLHEVEVEAAFMRQKLEIAKTGGDYYQVLRFWITQTAIWAVIFLYGAVALLELYAAKGLYKATKPGTDVLQAFKLSLNWLLVQIGSFVLRAVFHFARGSVWVCILESCVRIAAIYVVFYYTKRLKQLIGVYIQASGVRASSLLI